MDCEEADSPYGGYYAPEVEGMPVVQDDVDSLTSCRRLKLPCTSLGRKSAGVCEIRERSLGCGEARRSTYVSVRFTPRYRAVKRELAHHNCVTHGEEVITTTTTMTTVPRLRFSITINAANVSQMLVQTTTLALKHVETESTATPRAEAGNAATPDFCRYQGNEWRRGSKAQAHDFPAIVWLSVARQLSFGLWRGPYPLVRTVHVDAAIALE
eukprot:scaffold1415_cov242-Pinguiococcus_pyrenoidosus.AAC.1